MATIVETSEGNFFFFLSKTKEKKGVEKQNKKGHIFKKKKSKTS